MKTKSQYQLPSSTKKLKFPANKEVLTEKFDSLFSALKKYDLKAQYYSEYGSFDRCPAVVYEDESNELTLEVFFISSVPCKIEFYQNGKQFEGNDSFWNDSEFTGLEIIKTIDEIISYLEN